MTDEHARVTRRGFMVTVGGTALAGCGAIPNAFSSSPPTIDGRRLTAITENPVPSVPLTVPVTIHDAHVTAHIDRTQALLGDAPLPFEPDELPNGAMRDELNGRAQAARDAIEQARSTTSPFEAINTLRDARGQARSVAAGWAYADAGLRRSDLREAAEALAEDVAAFRDDWTYVGGDPVQAVVVHNAIETFLRTAAENADGQAENPRITRRPEHLLTVSGDAGAIERGRAALVDAIHLDERLRAAVASPRELGEVFETALADLTATLTEGTAPFDENEPVSAHVDVSIEDAPVTYPLEYLVSDLARPGAITDHRERGELAAAIRAIHRELTRLRAFETLRDRVEDGRIRTIETAEDIAALREAAVRAIETARSETAYPALSQRVLHNLVGLIKHADRELARGRGNDPVEIQWIRRDVGEYIYAAAVATVTPAVSDTVGNALKE